MEFATDRASRPTTFTSTDHLYRNSYLLYVLAELLKKNAFSSAFNITSTN